MQRAGLPGQLSEYALGLWGSVDVQAVARQRAAAAAAIGEMQFGLGQQYQRFFYVLITAALGGGLVVDGHYFRGER